MAYELRRPIFDLSGSLSAKVATNDLQITCQGSKPGVSNVFSALPTDYSTGLYLPLTLANDNTGKSEIVWVTGHALASPTLTVVRGREDTSPTTFDIGDVVRCAPTVRDVVGAYGSRSGLPVDPHIGMRALILDEKQVVERTSAGWDDSAALEDDSTRKHHWSVAGVNVSQQSSAIAIGPLGAAANNPASPIATLNSDRTSITLNKAGQWTLSWQAIIGSSINGSIYVELYWPSGAFPIGPAKGQTSHRLGGTGVKGNQVVSVEWNGYVPAAAAQQPIALRAFQQNDSGSLASMSFDATAEYLGA